MTQAAPVLAAAFFFLGVAAFVALPSVSFLEKERFAVLERYLVPPIHADKGTLFIRQQKSGKGHFGAPRNGGRIHKGADFLAPVGQPVFASASGRVTFAGEDKGYGLYVELMHPSGMATRYAHLSVIDAVPGAWVSAGQRIGLIGKTGNAIDTDILAHLHFEIRYDGHAVDPGDHFFDAATKLKLKHA